MFHVENSIVEATEKKTAVNCDYHRRFLTESLTTIVKEQLSRHGYFKMTLNGPKNSGDELEIKFDQITKLEEQQVFLPLVSINLIEHDSDDDVPYSKVGGNLIYPFARLERAVLAFVALVLNVRDIKDIRGTREHFGASTYEEVRDYYEINKLDQVLVSLRRGPGQLHLDLLGSGEAAASECAWIYYDDGSTGALVLYPSRQHLKLVENRLGYSLFNEYFKVIPKGRFTDRLFQLSDDKVLTLHNLRDMMLANYNVKLVPDHVRDVLTQAIPGTDYSDAQIYNGTIIIPVSIAKKIQAAHGIDMS